MTSGQAPSSNNQKWLVLSAVSVGAFISTLSGSIVNISLPAIADDLGVGISDIEWIAVDLPADRRASSDLRSFG